MQQIIDDREKMMDTLTAVDNGISNGEDELRGDISAVHDKQRKLMDHIQTREQHVVGEMQQIQNQLASMLALTQYQGADALNDVTALLDNAMIQDDQLQYQVDRQLAVAGVRKCTFHLPKCMFSKFAKFWRARARLCKSRFLRVRIHSAAC